MPCLLVSVRFHDGRYHGSGEWPPSPARLFQALVAGAARGCSLPESAAQGLRWLEALPPPAISAPPVHAGQAVKLFVPNNDLDAMGGDPARVGEIRTAKIVRPRHFDKALPLHYLWTFEQNEEAYGHAKTICEIGNHLYQLGRGLDMAWASGEVLNEIEGQARLRSNGGRIWRPCARGDGTALSCPQEWSFASLTKRFAAMRERFRTVGQGKAASQLFSQPPKAAFAQIAYDSPPKLLLFDIARADERGGFARRGQDTSVALTETVRDAAAARLKASGWRRDQPKREVLIDNVFVGSRDSSEADKAQRIRITPLPSIGFRHTDRSIRRVLVTVPPDCAIAAADIAWAFSGLTLETDEDTGEVQQELATADDRSMLDHYGIEDERKHRVWRTVTPAALPQRAARRRIDPRRMREEAKGGAERAREEASAAAAVCSALRHAGIATTPQAIRVQREPFEAKGARAEAFAAPPRFLKERLWHVEIAFAEPAAGPLVIGDGRYLGLGLMRPVGRTEGVFAFAITDGLAGELHHNAVSRALRRAVMARLQETLGARATLPTFFTGHEADGAPARSGKHEHLAFAFDAPRKRLLIIAPHILERRNASRNEQKWLRVLVQALEGFCELRAGPAGKLRLASCYIEMQDDPLFEHSSTWKNLTPYRVTRHGRMTGAAAALEADLLAECRRGGLPRPEIEVTKTFAQPGIGLSGLASLKFRAAVAGPILLGRDRHFGGGLFVTAG